ncbi:MAG: TolC family protein [candidate division Zixibacteria bacterium]|nr:TolC family protein [candidate division Zixibacteria bacterium]
MNLMEAVKLAFAADNNLKAARANLSASEAAIKSAKAAYFPKLLLTGSYSRMSKANELELSIPPIIERNIEIGTDIPFYANLGMSYELYSFGRRPSIARISRSEKKSSELGYRYARKELFDTVARAYLTTLFAGESLDLIEAETDRFTRIHQLIESRYNQEITPEFDFLQARLRLEHYKLAVLEAANNFEIASLNLARFLNMPVDQLPKLEERIGDSLFSLPQSTDQSEILSRREDLNQSRIVTDLASLAAKINKSAYFPSVSLFGAYDLRNGYQPDVGKVEENYSVGINLNWLLFDGFARRAEISRQTYIQKASGYLTDDLMLTIPFQVNSSQLAIVNSRTRIDVGEEALELARKAMIIAQTRYDLGDITMIELLDIENQRSESELGLLKLQYQYNLSQLNLKLVSSFYPEIELLY